MLERILRNTPILGPRLRDLEKREQAVREAEGHLDVPIIEFFCEDRYFDVVPKPVWAGKNLPSWFKKIPPHVANGARDPIGAKAMTAKRCFPLIDGMSLGYTMLLAGDVNVRSNDEGSLIEVTSGPFYPWASLHDVAQLGPNSPTGRSPAIKFHNPWVVRTRPGWSTLFISPMNGEEERFQCLGAVVDTDTYPKQINFPALWFANPHDDVIPAGTPLITAIPFKRDSVSKEIIARVMTEAEAKEVKRIENVQNSRNHYYTKELREKR
jgi:hypothetical protein